MDNYLGQFLELAKLFGPSVAILTMIVIVLLKITNKKDDQLLATIQIINDNTKTLERLTTLIEVLVSSFKGTNKR